jgi:hypothetical protein
MTVAETPEGLRPGDACNFIGNPGIRSRDGKSFPPKNFLKRNADGTADFLVRCHNFSSDPGEPPRHKFFREIAETFFVHLGAADGNTCL